jgi:hypothetical protein
VLERDAGDLATTRAGRGVERREHLARRALKIAPSNRMLYHTDAAHGVVPQQVADAATERWEQYTRTAAAAGREQPIGA